MTKHIDPVLKKKLFDPLSFIDPEKYKIQKRKKKLIAIAIILVGLACFVLMGLDPPPEHSHSNREQRGNFAVVVAAFGLPIWGLYLLMTVNRRVKQEYIKQLIWLHPELKQLKLQAEKKSKDGKKPEIIAVVIVIFILLIGIYFYIQSLIEFFKNY